MTKENPIQIEIDGKTITLRLDIPAMRRLRRYPEPIDIMKIIDNDREDGGLIGQMHEDPGIAVDIAFEAAHGDPNRPSDPVEFAKGISGDKLDEVMNKALQAVIAFCPDRKIRTALLAVKAKAAQAQEALGDKMLESLEDGTLDAAIKEATESIQAEAASKFRPKMTRKKKPTSKSGSSKPARSSESSTSEIPALSADSHSKT